MKTEELIEILKQNPQAEVSLNVTGPLAIKNKFGGIPFQFTLDNGHCYILILQSDEDAIKIATVNGGHIFVENVTTGDTVFRRLHNGLCSPGLTFTTPELKDDCEFVEVNGVAFKRFQKHPSK